MEYIAWTDAESYILHTNLDLQIQYKIWQF